MNWVETRKGWNQREKKHLRYLKSGVVICGCLEAAVQGAGFGHSLFVWLVPDGWCWFVLRKKLLLAGG
jgi:hypothetical protein